MTCLAQVGGAWQTAGRRASERRLRVGGCVSRDIEGAVEQSGLRFMIFGQDRDLRRTSSGGGNWLVTRWRTDSSSPGSVPASSSHSQDAVGTVSRTLAQSGRGSPGDWGKYCSRRGHALEWALKSPERGRTVGIDREARRAPRHQLGCPDKVIEWGTVPSEKLCLNVLCKGERIPLKLRLKGRSVPARTSQRWFTAIPVELCKSTARALLDCTQSEFVHNRTHKRAIKLTLEMLVMLPRRGYNYKHLGKKRIDPCSLHGFCQYFAMRCQHHV